MKQLFKEKYINISKDTKGVIHKITGYGIPNILKAGVNIKPKKNFWDAPIISPFWIWTPP